MRDRFGWSAAGTLTTVLLVLTVVAAAIARSVRSDADAPAPVRRQSNETQPGTAAQRTESRQARAAPISTTPLSIETERTCRISALCQVAVELSGRGQYGYAALKRAASHRHGIVRAVALGAMSRCDEFDEDAVPILLAALRDPELRVRYAAASTLLFDRLPDEDSEERLRRIARAIPPTAQIRSHLDAFASVTKADAYHVLALYFTDQFNGLAPWTIDPLAPVLLDIVHQLVADPQFANRQDALLLLTQWAPADRTFEQALSTAMGESHVRKYAAAAALRLGVATDALLVALVAEKITDINRLPGIETAKGPTPWGPVVRRLADSLDGDGPIPPKHAITLAQAIGSHATPLVPRLVAACKQDANWASAVSALAAIGDGARPALPHVLSRVIPNSPTIELPSGIRSWGHYWNCLRLAKFDPVAPVVEFDLQGLLNALTQATEAELSLYAAATIAPDSRAVHAAAFRLLREGGEADRETALGLLGSAVVAGSRSPDFLFHTLATDPSDRMRGLAGTILIHAAEDHPRIVPGLARTLRRGDALAKEFAARALAQIATKPALMCLAEALGSPTPLVRTWAALVTVEDSSFFDPPTSRSFCFLEEPPPAPAQSKPMARATEVLAQAANSAEARVRRLAVAYTAGHSSATSHAALAAALAKDRDPRVSELAARWVAYYAARTESPPSIDYTSVETIPPDPLIRIRALINRLNAAAPTTQLDVALRGALVAQSGESDPIPYWLATRPQPR